MGSVSHTTHGEALDSNNYNPHKKSSEMRGGKKQVLRNGECHTYHSRGGGALDEKTFTLSNEKATSPKSTKSKNSDSSLPRGAHSN